MGLDGVELVMEIEDEFGISIPDEEAEKLETPRMVADWVCSKLAMTDEATCQSQRAFHLLRRSLVELLGLPRRAVRLDMSLREHVPAEAEQELWTGLGAACAVRTWPGLELPPWMSNSLMAGGLVVFGAITALAVMGSMGFMLGIFAGLVGAIGYGIAAARLTRSYRTRIPSEQRTVRDLIPYVVLSERVGWSRETVGIVVTRIVMDQLGVSEEKYTEDSNFVRDFGMD